MLVFLRVYFSFFFQLLEEFSYNGDTGKIRKAIMKIFSEQKSSEMHKAIIELPVTVISSYVRLLKGFLWAESEVKTFCYFNQYHRKQRTDSQKTLLLKYHHCSLNTAIS